MGEDMARGEQAVTHGTLRARASYFVFRMLVRRQTIALEIALAVYTLTYGLVLMMVVPAFMLSLLSDVAIWAVGIVFMLSGTVWLYLISQAVCCKNVIPCRRAACWAFIIWVYLIISLVASAGFSVLTWLRLAFFVPTAFFCAWCWCRCDVVARGHVLP